MARTNIEALERLVARRGYTVETSIVGAYQNGDGSLTVTVRMVAEQQITLPESAWATSLVRSASASRAKLCKLRSMPSSG